MFDWLQNLFGNIDPFGLKAQSIANANLASQQQLSGQQGIQQQQEVATRQNQGQFTLPQYQTAQRINTPVNTSTPYTLPVTPTAQAGVQKPPYAPNVQNQTVTYGGATWKGNPGSDWTLAGTDQGGNGVDQLLSAFVDPVSKALDSWKQRLNEFDKNNPFAFDEAQAKASAGERLDPYFNANMNELLTGIRTASSRSIEDQNRTISELNADASKLSGQARLDTQEAIRSSEQGYAGSGLFFSGERQHATNVQDIKGQQALTGIDTNLQRGITSTMTANTRTQEDLALQRARQSRLNEADRTTAISTDVANQQREAEIRRAQEQLAYAGPAPGSTDPFGLQNKLYSLY